MNHWVSWSSSVQTSGGRGGGGEHQNTSDYSEKVKGSAAEPYLLWFSGPEEAPLQQVLEELEGLLGKKKK